MIKFFPCCVLRALRLPLSQHRWRVLLLWCRHRWRGEEEVKSFLHSNHVGLLVELDSKRHPLSFSCLSDAASGLSDGNDGGSTSGGIHEGRSLKRHQRRSVRSRSRHEKTARAKLNVLSVRSGSRNANQKILNLIWSSTDGTQSHSSLNSSYSSTWCPTLNL